MKERIAARTNFKWRYLKIEKKIETLIEDIHKVFTEDHKVDPKNLETLGENLKRVIRTSLEEVRASREPTLRMSIIGKPDRQLWFEMNQEKKEPLKAIELGDVDVFRGDPSVYLKFLFGDILEQLLLFLCVEAGHKVEHIQEPLELNGIKGTTDCTIDGIPFDVKSASTYSFKEKFMGAGLLRDSEASSDPFGYRGQLAAYREALLKEHKGKGIDPQRAGWLSIDKQHGTLNVLLADSMDLPNASKRIEHLKGVLSLKVPPEAKCYEDEPKGSKGNRVLARNCTYCPFKEVCWKDSNSGKGLKSFRYSDGLVYFTKVVVEPKVKEEI